MVDWVDEAQIWSKSTCICPCGFYPLIIEMLPLNLDSRLTNQKTPLSVIPAKAGIQCYQIVAKTLDPVFQRGDDFTRLSMLTYRFHICFLIRRSRSERNGLF